jgi:hypothetical protein
VKVLLLAGLLASTCFTAPKPSPDPLPVPIPDGGDDDAGPAPTSEPTPSPVPDSTCEAVFAHLSDIEAAPSDGHDAFLKRCAGFSSSALSCLLATDTPAIARTCLER